MKELLIPVNPFSMNCYIYFDEKSKEGVIFDPAAYTAEEKKHIKYLISDNNINIKYIINTHGHIDHILGNKFAKEEFKVPILCSDKDKYFFDKVEETANMYGVVLEDPGEPDENINEESKIKIGDIEFKILHTPGHSPGSLSFIDHKNKKIFCGDVIFKNSIGRTDLPFGDYDELMLSIQKIFDETGDDYELFPGHMEPTTVGEEKRNNPFLNE